MANHAKDESTLSLEISHRFSASPERVFDAWLGTQWGEWLPPAGAVCVVTLIDPRVGGGYHAKMTMADGRAVEISGVYREIVRPKRLVLTWVGNYNNQQTLITLTFRPDGAGTLMTLRQDGFDSAEQRGGYQNGWSGVNGSFDKLSNYLAMRAR